MKINPIPTNTPKEEHIVRIGEWYTSLEYDVRLEPEEMQQWAVDVINHGSWSVEWFDSDEADDA